MTNRAKLGKWASGAGAALALAMSTSDAAACGGFFCSQTPVDQTAERIIFTVNDDATVTAYIQVTYAGEKDDFAWVVPVPGAVDPGVFPQQALTALDLATQPSYSTSSCADLRLESDLAAGPSAAGGAGSAPDDGGVMVIQEQQFGPFESVTITGDDAEELVSWLQDNGYRITDSMVPYIEEYVEDGMAFFAMKLLPEADILDISPVKITYEGTEPMIPIRLTTVASQPEMGIVAWVLADEKYASRNYAELTIPDELIEFDFANYGSRNNYLTVVSKQADKLGGQAFVTEYAADAGPLAQTIEDMFVPDFIEGAQEAEDELVALLRSRAYITRLYTRMSAEEMKADPYFEPAEAAGDVSNVHNLQCEEGSSIACECEDGSLGVRHCGAPDYGWYGGCVCGDEPVDDPAAQCPVIQPPSPCSFAYCGRTGICLASSAADVATTGAALIAPVCVCAEGSTARPRTTTAGEIQLYCEPLEFNFQVLPDIDDPGVLMFPDPCDGFDCGANGACTTMNGTATCQCETGFGATVKSVNGIADIKCEAVQGVMPSLPLLPNIGETEIDPSLIPVEPDPIDDPDTAGSGPGGTSSGGSPDGASGEGEVGGSSGEPNMTVTPRSGGRCSLATGPRSSRSNLWLLGALGAWMVGSLRRRPLRKGDVVQGSGL